MLYTRVKYKLGVKCHFWFKWWIGYHAPLRHHCGDKISINIWHLILTNKTFFASQALTIVLLLYYRSWQGQEVYPDNWWFSKGCLASQELAQAPSKALKYFLNGLVIYVIQCESIRLNIKTFFRFSVY